MRPAEPPVSRRSRTGLIVSIVVLAVVLVGGGTAVLMLLNHPAPQAQVPAPPHSGPYQSLIKCAKLTSPPFTFDPEDEPTTAEGRTAKVCMGTFGAQRVQVAMTLYSGSNAEDNAVRGSLPWTIDKDFQRLNGTGFENAPFTGYNDDYGPICTAIYRRSNVDVRIDFPTLSNVSDRASCTSAIMPYVKQLYALIG
ncbi:MAG TPA: hypothetical protein VGN81_38935 [Pseudonocardiaceae bacterium]|jgi:hypothetical protein